MLKEEYKIKERIDNPVLPTRLGGIGSKMLPRCYQQQLSAEADDLNEAMDFVRKLAYKFLFFSRNRFAVYYKEGPRNSVALLSSMSCSRVCYVLDWFVLRIRVSGPSNGLYISIKLL